MADRITLYSMLLMCVGNDNLHSLTSGTRQRLRIDLGDFEGNTRYAAYDDLQVGSAEAKYQLVSLGTYSGTAGQCAVWYENLDVLSYKYTRCLIKKIP